MTDRRACCGDIAPTPHRLTRDLLAKLGAIPVEQRVVEDRNRITSASVTAGLDLAFVVAAKLASVNYAKSEMLTVENDPDPPFPAGTPKDARPMTMFRSSATAPRGFVMARACCLVIMIVLLGSRPERPGSAAATDQLAAALTSLLDSALARTPGLPGAMLRVEAPSLGFVWTKAIGVAPHRHGGFWGTSARHRPAIDLTVVGAVTNNAARPALAEAMAAAIGLMAAAIGRGP